MEADKFINKASNISIIILTMISSIMILFLKNISILLVITYLWIIVINENKRFNLKLKAYNVLEKQKSVLTFKG